MPRMERLPFDAVPLAYIFRDAEGYPVHMTNDLDEACTLWKSGDLPEGATVDGTNLDDACAQRVEQAQATQARAEAQEQDSAEFEARVQARANELVHTPSLLAEVVARAEVAGLLSVGDDFDNEVQVG